MRQSLANCSRAMSRYLLWFANEHHDFRLPELRSLMALHSVPYEIEKDITPVDPFMVIRVPCRDSLLAYMSRTVLVKFAYELWAEGRSRAEMYADLVKVGPGYLAPHQASSFSIRIEGFGKQLALAEKLDLIAKIDLDFQGRVDLTNPEVRFNQVELFRPGEEAPTAVYFGRWVANGSRDLITRFSLKKRHFIGTTSMDAGLSLIMANLAAARPAVLIFDPFVGTGSLLVACAHYGAYVMGTDIDYNIIHGRGKPSRKNAGKTRAADENIRTNMTKYGLGGRYVDVMVADADSSGWRDGVRFDAIITDPPYGVRESNRKVGATRKYDDAVDLPADVCHYPTKIRYGQAEMYKDLLNFSATHLSMNGRLLFWLPVLRSSYHTDQIPSHPCLQLNSNCEQQLNGLTSRRLITLEKVAEPRGLEDVAYVVDSSALNDDFRERYFNMATLSDGIKEVAECDPGSKSDPGECALSG